MGAYVAGVGWDAEAALGAKVDEAPEPAARLECEVRGRGVREEGVYSELRCTGISSATFHELPETLARVHGVQLCPQAGAGSGRNRGVR